MRGLCWGGGKDDLSWRIWDNLLHPFVDLLFPPVCAGCGSGCREAVCAACLSKLTAVESWLCLACLLKGKSTCCGRAEHRSFRCFTAYRFRDPLVRILHRCKYDGREDVGLALGELVGSVVRQRCGLLGDEIVVPVPLAPRKRRQRGYNQCDSLAAGIASEAGLLFEPACLRRVGNPRSQTTLDRAGRRRNVADTFVVSRPEMLLGARVLIVDDIVTTGSTLAECVRVVERAGAGNVISIAAAFAG